MLRSPMTKKDTQGFFIRPERRLVNQLAKLADEFPGVSANQVAVEIIKEYIEFWAEAERAKRKVFSVQRSNWEKSKQEMLRQTLHGAVTESESAPLRKAKK